MEGVGAELPAIRRAGLAPLSPGTAAGGNAGNLPGAVEGVWPNLTVKTKCMLTAVIFTFLLTILTEMVMWDGFLDGAGAVLGPQAEAAAIAIAGRIPAAWLAQHSPEVGGQAAFLDDLVRRLLGAMGTFEVQVVRHDGGRTAELIYHASPSGFRPHPSPGQRIVEDQSPMHFARDPGHMDTGVLGRVGRYVAGWAPVFDAAGQPVGTVVVLLARDRVEDQVRRMAVTILALAGVFAALAGYAGWRFGATFEQMAITDGLTGLYNHKHFQQQLELECQRAARYGYSLSLVLMDIDNFKKINDIYGHATGDLVLKYVASWVRQSCRATDLVARYGGDEIAVLLPHTDLAGAREFAERVRLRVAGDGVRDEVEGVTVHLTVSLGVAQFGRGLTTLDLVKRADAALYQSKRSGRNQVSAWDDGPVPDPDPAPVRASPGPSCQTGRGWGA